MSASLDVKGLDRMGRRLRDLRDADALGDFVEALADVWVDRARDTMGHDTWQLDNRTQVTYVSSTPTRAEATVEADTPYAGHHNAGTRFTAPNGFWDAGHESAEQAAERAGGRLGSHVERVLTSGGVWNPRSLVR